jgi:hypothetical protein
LIDDNAASLIRKRETLDDLLELERIDD